MANEHILIVEDQEEIAELLRTTLLYAGYTTSWIEDGNAVIPYVKKKPPSLILLDIMLPGKDGIEICREIRKFSNVPIIMLTARDDEIDRIVGLEIGADDYIGKPFSTKEVVARIKAVLRRCLAKPSAKVLQAGVIRLNKETYQFIIGDEKERLTPSEFAILKAMLDQPERIFSRDQLINRTQGCDFIGYERTIDFHIKNLRKKLAAHLPNQDIIRSVYGVGYRLVPPK
ncbi:response regulator [Desulfococcaceae bacterium HSG7]|nr:response regulator [Desulfococcaceae bacterium HSG7]